MLPPIADLPESLRVALAEEPLDRDTVNVVADWFEVHGDQAADGVRHAASWARRMGADAQGLWAEARVGVNAYLMRWIPAGLGVLSVGEGTSRAQTRHRSTRLASGFWLGATMLTEGQLLGSGGRVPGRALGGNHPALGLNQSEIDLVLRRLNANRHHPYRLPTHAEWEWAGRAGTAGPTWLPAPGADALARIAWFYDNSRSIPVRPVARLAPNPWGLYDMLGNGFEWCADMLDRPDGPYATFRRDVRGFDWRATAPEVRVDARARRNPLGHHAEVGFRLALGAGGAFSSG